MRIDAFASQPHYFDHIQPIWEALDADGKFYVKPAVPRPGERTRGFMPSDVPIIVAGYPDSVRMKRPVVFVEHGIGENYGQTNPSYSGGQGRDNVVLFLSPNRAVHEANEKTYPGRSVIVGSPRLEWLAQQSEEFSAPSGGSRDGRLRVAVSFHWQCTAFPQTKTALYHYQPYFSSWRDPRIEIKGHSHPRIRSRAEPLFLKAGIEYIPEFADVIEWADVYAVDNSSTLFEAAALGLDVVVLDAPHFPAEETGFRFWKYADIGPRISAGTDFVEAALAANHNRASYSDLRRQMVTEIFGAVEGSTQRAVKAINDHSRASNFSPSTRAGNQPTQPSLFSR